MSVITITLNGVDNATGIIDGAAGALSGLGDMVGGALTAGLAAGAAGVAGLTTVLGFSFSAALENEQAQSTLAQVIKATGGEAGVTADEANAMAEEFAHLAGGSDDAIIAIETIGLRAGTVAEEDFPRFIQASLDLGTVMGSTEAAATLLARAGDDIGASIGKAEKAGILFTDAEKEQMIAMQDAGDTAGALDLFMAKLAETTGGAAAANAETLTGKWELMKGKFGEAAESIGMGLLPLATQLFDGVIAPAIPIITDLATAFGGFIELLMQGDLENAFANLGEFEIFQTIFKELGINVYALGEAAQAVFTTLPGLFAQGQAAIQPLIDASMNLAGAFAASMPMIMGHVQGMVDFVINLFNTFSPTIIANVSSTLNSLAEFWTAHGSTIMGTVSVTFEIITTTIGGALTLVSGLISTALTGINMAVQVWSAVFQGDWQTAFDAFTTGTNSMHATLTASWTAFMSGVLSIVGTDLATFNATWSTNWSMAQTIASVSWSTMTTTITTSINGIVLNVSTAVTTFIGTWQTNWNMAGTIVSTAWNNIKLAIANAGLSIISTVQTLVYNISNAFNLDWGSIGTSIISNIGAGIGNAAAGLASQAASAAWNAYQAMLDALGMHSPSPMLIAVGEQLNQDVRTGIVRSATLVEGAARDSSLGVADATLSGARTSSESARRSGPVGGGARAGGGPTTVTVNVNINGATKSMQREIENAVYGALKKSGLAVNASARMGARA